MRPLARTDAAGRVCPFVRDTVNPRAIVRDREPAIVEPVTCMTDGCMAWDAVSDDFGRCLLIGDDQAEPGRGAMR